MSNIAAEFHYFSSQLRKSNAKMMILFFFFLSFFLSSFLFIKHDSKGVQCIRTILAPNECSTIRDLPFFVRAACKLRSTSYQTIALLSKISILFIRAVCQIRSASYEPKHRAQLLFDTTFCEYLHS